jgi:hypothetical protein
MGSSLLISLLSSLLPKPLLAYPRLSPIDKNHSIEIA